MTSWETDFLLAEAGLKGYINTDPKILYEKGVQGAFSYWDVSLPDNYLSDIGVAYSADNALEQIITQKWIASITNGFEGWIEYRRTGFPKLKQVSASLNNNLIPVRMPYPTDEEALNSVEYSKAAANTDNNSINARTWWDIN